jgi:hypothetical protein
MISLRRLLTLLAFSAWISQASLGAVTSPMDLGQGLAYFRVHSVAEDAKALEATIAGNGALVIDLRYATAQGDAASLLAHALAQRRGSELLCVLVSPATPDALTGPLSAAPVRLTTLGVEGSVPAAKVVVGQTAETDRRAYDALESGTTLALLLSGKIDKDRYDEAALMNDFSNGNTSGEPPSPDPKAAKDAAEKAPALVDRVLQRAVHLHRALGAIKPRS